jgi:hypothetical protein
MYKYTVHAKEQEMDSNIILNESKYIKQSGTITAFSYISFAFFFTLYVLPQYFGLPLPLFDFTILRFMLIIMFFFVLGIKQKQQEFMRLILQVPYHKVLLPYILVLIYTAILRVDVNALLNPVIELISFYLLIYIIKYCFGIKKTLVYILVFSYILTSLGLVEYMLQRSPFSYLETIAGTYSGRFMRSGYYRIMGPANHSLGYGLMLITMTPIVCYDIEKDEINIFRHKLLFMMVVINVLLTGSRSTLSVFLLELVMLILLSSKTNRKKGILKGSLFVMVFAAALIVFQNTAFAKYILFQITIIIDELMGTTYSIQYGANLKVLNESSNYRDQLIHIFQVDWLNPLLGIGRNRSFSCEINGYSIRSVDSFYIAEFIRYAYPGMISYIAFLLYFLVRMLINIIQKKSQISKILFTGSLCYCINILWLDSLQTLKYLYILFAIFCCLPENSPDEKKVRKDVRDNVPSKYFK